MGTYYIQEQESDAFTRVGRNEFFDTLNDGSGYLYYRQGGQHIALIQSNTNTAAVRACRQADNAENYAFATDSRCRDEKGHLCRYQHDEHGRVIRNAAGKPVSAKCTNCPRNGWIGGDRSNCSNCCIRNYCKVEDCARCPRHREYNTPLSLDRFEDDISDNADARDFGNEFADETADVEAIVENKELHAALHDAIDFLAPAEQDVIRAIFWDELSYRDYAAAAGISKSAAQRLCKKALGTLQEILKNYR